ncbi:glycoside hydrolase family 95 protein, partial [bacterium]|nr:glycoside hydrolase family 95 protein [bacterium]
EGTVWTGRPHEYHQDGAMKVFPVLRELCNESRRFEIEADRLEKAGERAAAAERRKAAQAVQRKAEQIGMESFMSVPLRQMAYQPFGDLRLSFPGHTNVTEYRRSLDLDAALARVSYRVGSVRFQRQCFASYPDRVVVCRIEADRPGQVSFRATMDSPHASARTSALRAGDIVLSGQVTNDGVRFEARLHVRALGGRTQVLGDTVQVEGADSALLVLAGATSFRNFQNIAADPSKKNAAVLRAVSRRTGDELLSRHQADHRALFRRVSIDLGTTQSELSPTDERIRRFAIGNDPGLAALVFQYGRYLLIASSREGGQAANLQGVWNDLLRPPWDSKWTVNI